MNHIGKSDVRQIHQRPIPAIWHHIRLPTKYRAPGHPSLAFVDGDGQLTMLLTGVPTKASIEDALQPLLP